LTERPPRLLLNDDFPTKQTDMVGGKLGIE
jgi:hypothetical protein